MAETVDGGDTSNGSEEKNYVIGITVKSITVEIIVQIISGITGESRH